MRSLVHALIKKNITREKGRYENVTNLHLQCLSLCMIFLKDDLLPCTQAWLQNCDSLSSVCHTFVGIIAASHYARDMMTVQTYA